MEHPIHNMLEVSLENIKEMIDVNTIVGEPIKGMNDLLIIPISKVKMGFASGGSEFVVGKEDKTPFGGGTGGSVFITPVAFLVINKGEIKLLRLSEEISCFDEMINNVGKIVESSATYIQNKLEKKEEQK